HAWQNSPGDSDWHEWVSLGGTAVGIPAVHVNLDGRLEVFIHQFDGQSTHIWQLTPGGNWSAWDKPGGSVAGNVSVAANADGRLEVFVRWTDNTLRHLWQTAPGGVWSGGGPGGWASLGGTLAGDPTAVRRPDGHLEVFATLAPDSRISHIWQTSPGGSWSSWAPLASPQGVVGTPGPAVGINAD